ncbi:uncharacterized protein CDV56_109274 [Aspergillus thermomutatus]|uniref:Uncharacterized protein n=1 Tax=Aspergillus thermomutatus TaxID=41047 RepID=A0A397HQT9_ASPTH|nr:uncharacterized protein CDV56_109274 [Aspergillus thermomutatus]RHZ65531.1 hypothetical protein CDV56_109274 [Aspergillus thermomutatus]
MERLLQRMTLSREKSEDLETQGPSVNQKVTHNKRLEFIQLLFGINSEAIVNFPGIESYCDYLEHGPFQQLMDPTFDLIWDLMSRTNPRKIADCWDWSLAVLQVTQSEQPLVSIHDILQRIEERVGNSKQSLGRDQDKTYLYMAIFGVLCWSSLVVRPRLIFTDDVVPNLTCLLPQGFKSTKSSTTHRLNDRCMRPIPTTFRSFQLQHWGDQTVERTQGRSRETDSLYEASLNIYSLCYFGHVTIQWVDTISEHLRFNPANRRLSIFRFPTFCALLAVHGDNVCSAIRSIAEQLDPLSPEDRDHCCVSLEQEIILSYRLLFGQDGKSRKVAREELFRLKNSSVNQSVDTMLLDLCERKYEHGSLWWKTYDKVLQGYPSEIWPITCRTMEGHLQQNDVYSARDDFPRLGPRLLKLQQFNSRQRPSKLTDLWRDRRNPLQWYTFWAVILVGGVANILAALQFLVALVQLQTSF